MTKDKFTSILKEYGYSDLQADSLWNGRLNDDIDEERLRDTASSMAPEAAMNLVETDVDLVD